MKEFLSYKITEFWEFRVRFRYSELVYLIYEKKNFLVRSFHFRKVIFPLFSDSRFVIPELQHRPYSKGLPL